MHIPPKFKRIVRSANEIIGIVYAIPVVPIYIGPRGYKTFFLVRLMTSISKVKNTPIVLKDKISLKSKLINYAIFPQLSSLPKSVASYCKKGR